MEIFFMDCFVGFYLGVLQRIFFSPSLRPASWEKKNLFGLTLNNNTDPLYEEYFVKVLKELLKGDHR